MWANGRQRAGSKTVGSIGCSWPYAHLRAEAGRKSIVAAAVKMEDLRRQARVHPTQDTGQGKPWRAQPKLQQEGASSASLSVKCLPAPGAQRPRCARVWGNSIGPTLRYDKVCAPLDPIHSVRIFLTHFPPVCSLPSTTSDAPTTGPGAFESETSSSPFPRILC